VSGRQIFLSVTAVVVVAILVVAHAVLFPFVLALLIAYMLTPVVSWLEGRFRMSRVAGVCTTYAALFVILYAAAALSIPRLAEEVGNVRRDLPALVRAFRDDVLPKVRGLVGEKPRPVETLPGHAALVVRPQGDGSYAIEVGQGVELTKTKNGFLLAPPRGHGAAFDIEHLGDETRKWVESNTAEVVSLGRAIISGVSKFIFTTGITLMLAAYLILTRERLFHSLRILVHPRHRSDLEAFMARVDRGLAGVIRGQLLICLVNGALTAIGFAAVKLKYWPVLAIVATLFSIVPIFGAIMSSIPAVVVALTQSLGTAVFVLGWIIGIHQIEANFLNPKIMGDAAKLHPVLVVFSLLAGEHHFGVAGALFAVPCMSILQSVFLHFRYVVHRDEPAFSGEALLTAPPLEQRER
jgi:predicted PurR-regulated permease PerM